MTIRRIKMIRRKKKMIKRRKRIFLSFLLITIFLITSRTSSYSVFAGNKLGKAENSAAKLNSIAAESADWQPNTTNYVSPEQNGLVLSKKVEKVIDTDDKYGRQIFQIDLHAEAISNVVVKQTPADIILILDNSSSLSGVMDAVNGEASVKMERALKDAAENFAVNLKTISPKCNIAVINSKPKQDATTCTKLLSVGTEIDDIKTAIEEFDPNSGVAVDNGLAKAEEIYAALAPDPDRARIVIVVAGSSNWGTSNANYAYNSANNLKSSYNASIYTIGIYQTANSLDQIMWNVSSNNPYSGTLPGNFEYLPNTNLPNGIANHYLTTTNVDTLNAIFDKISEQLGTTLKNAVVRDYIDSRFNLIDSNGNQLQVGETISAGNYSGTIRKDASGGIYIEWTDVELAPPSADNSIPAKTFTASIYVEPKDEFIGGNNVPTNSENISAVYAVSDGQGINVGSFPIPLVNVPLRLKVNPITDYVLLGEGIPKDEAGAQNEIFNKNLSTDTVFVYPPDNFHYAWSTDFTKEITPETVSKYTLTITANPVEYIQDTADDHYQTAVGTLATSIQATGVYTVIPVKPIITGSDYNIFLGETAGDGGATTLANALSLSIPDNDISGNVIPPKVKTDLEKRLTDYELAISVTYQDPEGKPNYENSVYNNSLINYAPTESTKLYLTVTVRNILIEKDIHVKTSSSQKIKLKQCRQ